MAALSELASKLPSAELTDLRDLRASDLAALLEEETVEWHTLLDWDFSASADLVQRFVDQKALGGYGLIDGGEVVGYSYFVQDEHKGLIGDLYVREPWRTTEREIQLLAAVVEALMRAPFLCRIETQLMMLSAPADVRLPGARFLRSFDRLFLRAPLDGVEDLAARALPSHIICEQWADRYQEAAAHLIPEAYAGHIDSLINDQYDTVSGARRFLYNVVQYPGCGSFFRTASSVALDRGVGSACGVCLGSRIAPEVGHITQICLSPDYRGQGLGYELLRRALCAFRRAGCSKVTLTVTAANREAIELYRRVGFEPVLSFRAFVWQGF